MIYPAPGFLLIEILQDPQKTKEGIYLPQDLESEPMKGKVLAVGNNRFTEEGQYILPPTFNQDKDVLKKGDVIYFKPHTQHELPGYTDTKTAIIPFEVVMCLEVEDDNNKNS